MKSLKQRRIKNQTNYSKRLKMLQGEKPRMVLRKTNKYIIAQYVESKEAQDKIVFGLTSKALLKKGWPEKKQGSLKSISAAYLLGYWSGKILQKKKLKNPIVDIGMNRNIHKNKFYGFLKGFVDAGVETKYKKEIFPNEEKIKGKDIPFDKIKSELEKE